MKRDRILAVAMLLFIAVSWFWFASDRPGALLPSGSVWLASVSDWADARGQSPATNRKSYFWTDKGDLLHLASNQDGSSAAERDILLAPNTFRPDTAPPIPIPLGALSPFPTPDGRYWLYGMRRAGPEPDVDVHLRTMAGRDGVLSARWASNPVWLDDRHWLISRSDGVFLNSLDGLPARKLDTSALSAWTPYVLGVTPQSRVISTLGNDQFDPPTPFRRGIGMHTPSAVLTEFDPNAPARNPKTWTVTMPPEALRGRILLSPQGDKILWITEKQASGFELWMNRLRSGFYRAYEGDETIYVSQLTGGGLKKLFSGPVERQKRGSYIAATRPLTDIQWLPDGKHFSYIYKNNLYVAPVD